MPQGGCIEGTARALSPGNECRDDSLGVARASPWKIALIERDNPQWVDL
jgi:hypothetical protein